MLSGHRDTALAGGDIEDGEEPLPERFLGPLEHGAGDRRLLVTTGGGFKGLSRRQIMRPIGAAGPAGCSENRLRSRPLLPSWRNCSCFVHKSNATCNAWRPIFFSYDLTWKGAPPAVQFDAAIFHEVACLIGQESTSGGQLRQVERRPDVDFDNDGSVVGDGDIE